jgi:cobalamin biosynthesis protein CobW
MPTPVYVISGFLGSGKTTLINNILDTSPVDKKIMVLVNEFGSISIDRKIINTDPNNVKEKLVLTLLKRALFYQNIFLIY